MKRAYLLEKEDSVATMLEGICEGETAGIFDSAGSEFMKLEALEAINEGHKIALVDIKKGEQVLKYGYPIGLATADIKKGSFVHVHNIESMRGRGDLCEN